MPSKKKKQTLTRAEVAAGLGVSRQHLLRMNTAGVLKPGIVKRKDFPKILAYIEKEREEYERRAEGNPKPGRPPWRNIDQVREYLTQ